MEAWKEAFNNLEISKWEKPRPEKPGIYCVGDKITVQQIRNKEFHGEPYKCTMSYENEILTLRKGDGGRFGVRSINASNRRCITVKEIVDSLSTNLSYIITRTKE